MGNRSEFQIIFQSLKLLLTPYQPHLTCSEDDEQSYSLSTHHIMKNQKPLFFGAAQINKNYVSYHLMPVYVFPELLNSITPELQRRMQGKSCFNFKSSNQTLTQELEALTKAGYNKYLEANYIETTHAEHN